MHDQKPYAALMRILRSTLEQIEYNSPNDPTVAETRASLARTIAELEVTRGERLQPVN